jgi:hypothetical protein
MRRLDGADLVEVEIEDGLQRLAGSGVVERFRQRFEPLRVFALQSDEFRHGIAPALMAAAAIGGPTVADDASTGVACPVAGLPLGPAKRLVALWFASSRHDPDLRMMLSESLMAS